MKHAIIIPKIVQIFRQIIGKHYIGTNLIGREKIRQKET